MTSRRPFSVMHRTRYLIGLLTLVLAVVFAVAAWELLGRAQDQPGLHLRLDFRDARGLRAGADVRYRGVTVGTVAGVNVAGDGTKAVVDLVLDAAGGEQACVNSSFWIVSPRFSGLTSGASGLDTLVRDAYVAFLTPPERGSRLLAGSLLAGVERPPSTVEPDAMEPIAHGDLLMTLLVPENHGLKPGSPVVFRGMQTGDVRGVQLAKDGTHVEVQLRIGHRHRRTVTSVSRFWVARPQFSAGLTGVTVSDVTALLSPFVSYVTETGKGTPVEDGYRAATTQKRPEAEVEEVPVSALARTEPPPTAPRDPIVLVRVVYAAVEVDTFSADDELHGEGTGVLYLDGSGRAVVLTPRSAVDGSYTASDAFGGEPDVEREQIRVVLPSGSVLRAHRVWVAPDELDLCALVLDEAPPSLVGTPPALLAFAPESIDDGRVRAVGDDGETVGDATLADEGLLKKHRGGAIVRDGTVIGLVGQSGRRKNGTSAPIRLGSVPADLRPGS